MDTNEMDSKEIFQRVFEQHGLGIFITDIEGRIQYANSRRLEVTDYSVSELIGHSPSLFKSGLTSQRTYQEMWETILAGHPWRGELLNKRKNGEIVRECVCINPLQDGDGQLTGFCATVDESLALRTEVGQHPRTAIFDTLTGLPSLPAMLEQLGALLRGFSPQSKAFALFSVGLDGFRNIQDSLGRTLTDRILIEVANRIQNTIRRGDAVGRVEGDEFIVVLNGSSAEGPSCIESSERLLAAIAAPISIDGHDLSLTASIGITRFPLDGSDADVLLANAVSSMLTAKREGGNCYRFFEPNDQEQVIDRLAMPAELRRDISNHELGLHYQPKLSLRTGEIMGFEALVRWTHPQRGLIAPQQFISVAEETGLIAPLSEQVLRTALYQAKAWQDQGLRAVSISINLSVRHLYLIDLPRLLARLLAETGLDAKCVELELGEGAVMRDAAQSMRMVDRLRAIGVQLSLDSFGTGYSSLAHLSRFEVSRLKIDRMFIEDITTNPVNASIVSAMIAMAHKLGKKIVAMGVETEAQMNFLRRQECDEMQGFLFSRPCSAEEAGQMLRDGARLRFDGAEVNPDGRKTLLLVDDEPNILSALKRLFRRENYTVLTANSGAEALELLALHPVHVVISDQRMPGMSGIDLLIKVKSLYPDTVRIILSGYSELGTVTDAINRGAVLKYLTKPWDDEQLKDEVRKAFAG